VKRFGDVAALACAVIAALWLSGCAGQKATPATDFTLKDLSGKSWTLSGFQGKSNVLIHFGTTWCPPCIAEIPTLNSLNKQYADRLTVLYIDSAEADGVVRNFVKDKGIEYTTLLDAAGDVSNTYNVTAIPQNLLVDKQGMIVSRTIEIPDKAIAKLVGQ
jgi:peroxiredoxin